MLSDGASFCFVGNLGPLLTTGLTYQWIHSAAGLILVVAINGFFTMSWAYTWMAVYPAELFTSTVRSTAFSFIFDGRRMIAWIFPIIAGSIIQRFGNVAHAAVALGAIYLVALVVPWLVPETTESTAGMESHACFAFE